jgi:hypothetical protein
LAGEKKELNSRKTPPLARRVELLGTIALHWKTPPLARRAELLGTSLYDLGFFFGGELSAGLLAGLSEVDFSPEAFSPEVFSVLGEDPLSAAADFL